MVFGRFLLAVFFSKRTITRLKFAERLGCNASYLSLLASDHFPSVKMAEAIERETDGAVPAASWGIDLSTAPTKIPALLRRSA